MFWLILMTISAHTEKGKPKNENRYSLHNLCCNLYCWSLDWGEDWMMNTRETLIEILNKKVHDDWFTNEEIADYLIANGVTVTTDSNKYPEEHNL